MANYINGGTLYPTYTGGYDISPEEQALIDAAANGRTVSNAGPNTSAMLQDLMGRAMYEQSIAEKQYRQRQDDERNQMLAEQDMALQEQAQQNQFGRQSQLVKAGAVGRVAEAAAGAVNPYTGETGGMDTGSLVAELDKILGNSQPVNTGISKPSGITRKGKNGGREQYDPTTKTWNVMTEGPEKPPKSRLHPTNMPGGRTGAGQPNPTPTATAEAPRALPKGFDEESPLGKLLKELINMKRLTPEEYQKAVKDLPPIFNKAG